MTIKAITGKPGSGKTYLAIDHLLKKYFKKENGEYLPSTDMTIITNIDALKLEHISLDAIFEDLKKEGSQDPVRTFFSVEYHEKFHEKNGRCLLVIDECQRYFPTMLGMKSYAPEIYFFFEYHRHFGYDIYLISQDKEKIAKGIRPLIETEIQALPRTVSITGEMKYYEFVDDEKISAVPKIVRPKKEIFNLYKSMTFKENEKQKNPVLMFAGIALLLILVTIYGGYRFISGLRKEPEKKIAYKVQSPVERVKEKRLAKIKPPVSIDPVKIWVRVDWAKFKEKLFLYDPEVGAMVDAKFFKHELRRDGSEYYAKVKLTDRGRLGRSRSVSYKY